MLLAIDIGNTTTNVGVFAGGRLRAHSSFPSRPSRTGRATTARFRTLIRAARLPSATRMEVLICSVVPRRTAELVRALRPLSPVRIRRVGRDVRVPLTNRYRFPRQVGQDRLVGAYAAWRAYRRTCIVVDFGTAITIDVVTRSGAYLGGVIAPGLEISRDALAARTALLPRASLRRPPALLGRDTASSIRAGLLYGTAALCDGLVGQLKRRYAPHATVVATGGTAALVTKHTRTTDHLKPHLVLEGLYQLSAS